MTALVRPTARLRREQALELLARLLCRVLPRPRAVV